MRLGDLDALARAIKTECNPYGKPTIDFESGKKVLKIIDDASTIEERPKGKWIIHNDYNENCRYGCNQCGNLTNRNSSFCPNCGADMKGE